MRQPFRLSLFIRISNIMGNNIRLDRENQAVCSRTMTDEPANDMKARLAAALKKKQEAAANTHGDTKATGKMAAKGAKQPRQRIIRHQGR